MRNADLLPRIMIAGSVSSLAAAFLVQYATKTLGRKNTVLCLLIASALASSLFFWVGANQVKLMLLCYIVINLLQGPVMVVMWAMFADTVDYSEWKTGRRATGLVLSAVGLSQWLGWKVAATSTGWILTLIGLKANVLQTAATQTGIRMMMSFFPAAAVLLSATVAFFYPLDEKTIKQVGTDLNARRAAEGQPAY